MTIELKVSAAPELTQNLYEAENDELCSRTQLFEKIANKKGVPRLEEHLFISFSKWDYIKNPSKIPAATAEPITPATLGPIACINK